MLNVLIFFRHLATSPGRIQHQRQRGWRLADRVRDLLHALRPTVRLLRRSTLEKDDHGLRRLDMGGSDPHWIIHAGKNLTFCEKQLLGSIANTQVF